MLNKFALITGATSGIGYEMAKILASKKINLLIASRNEAKLKSIKDKFENDFHARVEYFSVDFSEVNSSNKLFEFTEKNNISIEILINNAGIGVYGEHSDLDIKAVSKMLQLNIVSLSELSHYYGNKMKKQRSGKILNISSTAAYQPTPYFAAYGASKSYVLNFSEALAKELEDYNVTVSCLSPGPIDTNFYSDFDKSNVENPYLNKKSRLSVEKVAEMGIDIMLKGKLSKIVGTLNTIRVFSSKFATRGQVASISKGIMKPK